MNPYKGAVSKFIYFSGLGGLTKLFLKHPACAILAYHRVCPYQDQDPLLPGLFVTPDLFEAQMNYLKRRYAVISLEELVGSLTTKKGPPENGVVITFDDGYEDNYRFVFPILKKLFIPATIFVPTAYMGTGRSFWWDRLSSMLHSTREQAISFQHGGRKFDFKLSSLKEKERFLDNFSNVIKLAGPLEEEKLLDLVGNLLCVKDKPDASCLLTWDQLREMQDHGIHVGAHTDSHCAIACLNKENLYQELYASREALERHLDRKIEFMAYPYGEQEYVNDNFAMVKEAGYKAGVTTTQGSVFKDDDPFLLRRISIGGNDPSELFKLKVAGVWHYLLQVRRSWRSQ